MPKAVLPKYEWSIDENESLHGVKVMSLVDEGAIESDFIYFNNTQIKEKLSKQKPTYVKFEVEGYKQIVAGLSMIPDKEILRYDEEKDEYYVGYFSADTIEIIRNKFHKEMMTSNVNTDHEQDAVIDAYLIESFIITSDKQVEDLKDKGIEEAQLGAWFTAYKVEDEETFQRVIDGELNGFSVEIFATRMLDSTTEYEYNKLNNINNKLINTMKEFFKELKGLVEKFEKDESTENVKFVSATDPEKNIVVYQEAEEWTIGDAIFSQMVTEDGEESLEPLADGEYTLEDGVVLVVADGVLSEIRDAEDEEAPEEETPTEDVVEAEDKEKKLSDVEKSLNDLIDLSKDGYYTIEVGVEAGKIKFGAVYASTYKELELSKEEFNKLKEEKANLEKEVVELKNKIKEPIVDPELGFNKSKETINDDEYFSEANIKKYGRNYLKLAKRNNLPLV